MLKLHQKFWHIRAEIFRRLGGPKTLEEQFMTQKQKLRLTLAYQPNYNLI